MTKVCFVLSSLAGGGAERFFIYLLNSLDRSKFDIRLILFTTNGDYKQMIPNDIITIDLGTKAVGHGLDALMSVFRLRTALHGIKPDTIFSTMGYTNLICMVAKSIGGMKFRLIVHEAGILRDQLSFGSLSGFKKCLYKFFCRFADAVVFPVNAAMHDFESYIGAAPAKYRVIPTPLDTQYVDRKISDPFSAGMYGLKTDRKIIVSMGRLEKIKGFDLGIKAFSKLRRRRPCYYWILGQGTEEANLKALARTLGVEDDVFFLGFQDNPFMFIKNADAYLLPSRSETLPYAITEAMYCQCPCVATPYNASAGELIVNGQTGFLVKDFDADQLADALNDVLASEELGKKMGLNARLKAQSFSVRNVIAQYEELFKQWS